MVRGSSLDKVCKMMSIDVDSCDSDSPKNVNNDFRCRLSSRGFCESKDVRVGGKVNLEDSFEEGNIRDDFGL
ncbi:hypothetical protein Tco_1459028 [Tanacetum coccineum]